MRSCEACGGNHVGPCPAAATHASAPQAVASPHLMQGQMVGEYRIEGLLGKGAMGSVYAAIHPVIKKRAAIKVISPALCTSTDAVERFVQEARAVNEIGHPNIVDIFSLGVLPDGRSYFAMEWLQGESVRTRLRRGQMLFAEALDVLCQIAEALAAAHAAGIVHRDLKPDNVFLVAAREGRPMVKLLDFGLAKLAGGEDLRAERTRSGVMMGTPLYMSPEQARGKDVDHQSDVYSFGVMAFEMLVGRPPFLADSPMEVIAMHMFTAPPSAFELRPKFPPELEQLLRAMMAKDPVERPALSHVRTALGAHGAAALAMGMPTPLPGVAPVASVPSVPVSSRRQSRRGLLWALSAVVLIGAVATTIAVGASRDRVDPDGDETAGLVPRPAPTTAPAPATAPAKEPPPAPDPASKAPPPAPATDPAPEPPPPVKARVTVEVNVAGADIVIGDQRIAADATGRGTLAVSPGRHQLSVSAPGRAIFHHTLDVAAGEVVRMPVTLSRERRRTPRATRPATPIPRLEDKD